MLQHCRMLRAAAHRSGVPNMARLLYGKRKNTVHGASKSKPTVVGMLLQVPVAELHGAARRAAGLGELPNEAISEVLRKCRALNRFDRSEIIVEAVDEAKLGLTSSHYCTLMAHANDNKDCKSALRYWERACGEKKANSKLHGALLATYRSSGLWKDAVRHYAAMMDDRMGCDPYALHTVMNACRRAGAGDVGLAVFSKAVQNKAAPNSTVYLELLRCMQQSRLPNRWRMSLAVLHSLDGTIDVTAGLYNATISTMAGAMWVRGVEVFHTMREKSVQPSKDTLATLVSLNPSNTSHVVQCVAEAHQLGMPVTDSMYRAVLTNLTKLQLDHEAVRFATREYSRGIEDPGNPVNSSLALGLAILDTLLSHSRPKDALLFFDVFASQLGHIVGVSSRGLGSLGLRSQRWIVQGRVAVLDHNVILSPRFESLLSHYDSLLVPFSSVRLLVCRVKEDSGTVKGRYTKQALKRLQKLLEANEALRVLPLVHQLSAHTYIVDGPVTSESVEFFRQTVRGSKKEEAAASAPLAIRKRDSVPITVEPEYSEPDALIGHGGTAVQGNECRILKYSDRITAPERVLAVAAMLKTLNPDTSVHVLSNSELQLQVVENWNKLRSSARLTAVRYPDEVTLKAPSEQQQPGEPDDVVAGERRHEGKEFQCVLVPLCTATLTLVCGFTASLRGQGGLYSVRMGDVPHPRNYPSSFTEEFTSYCRAYRLPAQLFHDLNELLPHMPRYVRVRPCDVWQGISPSSPSDVATLEVNEVAKKLSEAAGIPNDCVQEVTWLPKPYFLALPRNVAMNHLELYKRGVVSAMDAASAAAVVALRPRQGESVWDVCCSPGMKLSFMADAVGEHGSVVGTDISLDRLYAARSVMKKHRIRNACLFAADGSSFSLRTAIDVARAEVLSRGRYNGDGLTTLEERRLRALRKRRDGENDRSRDDGATAEEEKFVAMVFASGEGRTRLIARGEAASQGHFGFDRVLVDAECCHDGSLAHLFLSKGTKKPFCRENINTTGAGSQAIDNERRMQRLNLSLPLDGEGTSTDARDVPSLLRLQLQLLTNGYEQLNPGGTLVYCTCSFTYQQNEYIVREMVRSVNASRGTMQHYRGEAVSCPPFSYEHEAGMELQLSPIVTLSGTQIELLKQRLESSGNPYGIVPDLTEECGAPLGARLWPHVFNTSFQFIGKIWKKPLA